MSEIKKGDSVHLRSANTGKILAGTAGDAVTGLFGEALVTVKLTDGRTVVVDPGTLWK